MTRGVTSEPPPPTAGTDNEPALCRALPHGTDWAWRPEVWTKPRAALGMTSVVSQSRLGRGVSVFHDCPRSEVAMHQTGTPRTADGAAFGLHVNVFDFKGSFLSLVLDLPQPALIGLTRQHLVRLDTIIAVETALRIFARLNVEHGPNTERIVRELPRDAAGAEVEFDLAYSNLDEKRLQRAWIDLIFERPHMTGMTLHDVVLSRRLRAAL